MTRLVFFGSPHEATHSLRRLLEGGHDIVAAYTQPDRIASRGGRISPTPVKEIAVERGILVRTPASLRPAEVAAELAAWGAEAFVVVAYGKLLPPQVLAIPRLGVLNLHPSLLPRHRGPSPVATAILEGDRRTGVTVMLLDEGMDTGPLLAQSEPVPIEADMTRTGLSDRLFKLGAELLAGTLERYVAGDVAARPQDESEATLTRRLKRSDGEIDWTDPADSLERMIRAYEPWPGTFTQWQGKTLKILAGRAVEAEALSPGRVGSKAGRLLVGTGRGALQVDRMQLEGRRAVSAEEFLRGHSDIEGETLPSARVG